MVKFRRVLIAGRKTIMMFIQIFDNSILQFIQNNMHFYILDKIMILLTNAGEGGLLWIVLAVILLFNKKHRKTGVIVIGAVLLTYIFGELALKNIICRVRPCYAKPLAKLLIPKPHTYSFPSGHSSSSFAAAIILSKYIKKGAPLFYTLAAGVAFSRMYLYVHYPSDIIAGIILGILCAAFSELLWNKLNTHFTHSSHN